MNVGESGGGRPEAPADASADPSLVDAALPERVLLVEDHELLAQSLVLALRAEGIEAERAPLTSTDAVLETAGSGSYELVLLDLDLGPGLGYSLPLIKPLQRTGARVVILTAVTDRERLAECIEEGAIGLVSKSQPFDQLLAALHDAVALGTLLKPGQRDDLLAELRRQRHQRRAELAPFEGLTRREREVLGALMEGKTAEDIASEWFVAMSTVRSQIRSLLAKLGVHSQVAAIGMARRAGWSPPQQEGR